MCAFEYLVEAGDAHTLHVSPITINYSKNVANSAACRRKRARSLHILVHRTYTTAIGGHTVKID